MATCPRCGVLISETGLPPQACPSCGHSEHPARSTDESDLANSQTIQSDEFSLADLPPPSAAAAAVPGDISDEASTLQSDEFVLQPPAADAPRPDRTMEISEDDDPRLSGTIQSEEFLLDLQAGTAGAAPGAGNRTDGNATLEIDSQDDPRLSQTMQSDEFAPTDGAATMQSDEFADPHLSATMQSEDFAVAGEDRTIAADGLSPEGAYLSDALPPDQLKTMQTVWAGAVGPAANQNMTIRGAGDEAAVTPSNLVIAKRKLAEPTATKATGEQSDYDLIRVLGEGGMGVVYDARQRSVDRNVALKMLKPKTAGDARQQQKFLAEAVVTGDLDHPNIVPIYDVGSSERGLLFYAMKKVQGTPWMKVLTEKSVAENLEILMKVGDALAFAHSRGVIHRDLKPENVMLGDFGEVLVMDWGLALPAPGFSKTASINPNHTMGGTPAYMAPEMASGPITKITFRSDIYLLGAILYEVLTGKAPHTGKNTMQCLFSAARNEIRPTEKTGELMEIAFKAMATDAEQRYATVREFQAAIRDYQSHAESITLAGRAALDLAKAVGTGDYRDYSRALFGYEEALALWEGNARARSGLTSAREQYARCAFQKEDYDLGLSLLDPADPSHAELHRQLRDAQVERNARVLRLQRLKRLAIGMAASIFAVITGALFWINHERNKAVKAEQVAVDERQKAVEAGEKEKEQREIAEQAEQQANKAKEEAIEAGKKEKQQREIAERAEQEAKRSEREAIAAKSAQEYEAYIAQIGLAAALIDENAFDTARTVLKQCPPERRNWEWGRLAFLTDRSWKSVRPATRLDAVAVSPTGAQFITGGWDGTAQIWDTASGRLIRPLPHTGRYVHGVAWSPDGRWIVTVGNDRNGSVRLWNAATGELVKAFDGHTEPVMSVAFFPDSQRFVTGSLDTSVRLWNLQTGESQRIGKHNGWVWSVSVSPDSGRIASAGQDGAVILWSVSKPESAAKFLGHSGPVYAVAFSPDGTRVASGGYDKSVLLWNPEDVTPFDYARIAVGRFVSPPPFTTLAAHQSAVRSVAFSPSGLELLSAGQDNILCLWDLTTTRLRQTYRGHGEAVRSCAFDATGRFIYSASYDGSARVWNRDEYESEYHTLADNSLRGHRDAILGVAFSRDGTEVVTASRDRSARSWNLQTSQTEQTFAEGHEFLASNAAYTRDGKTLYTAAVDNTVRAWDARSGLQLARLERTGRSAAVAVSPGGEWLLTGSDNQAEVPPPGSDAAEPVWWAQVWRVANLKPGVPVDRVQTLGGHKREVSAVAFSPDGLLAATADARGKIQIWNTADWSLQRPLMAHTAKVTALMFVDNTTLLSASLDKTVTRWNLQTGEFDNTRTLRHPDAVVSLALLNGQNLALTACNDGKIRLWNLADATELDVLWQTERETPLAVDVFEHRALILDSSNREVRIWDLDSRREISFARSGGESGPFLRMNTRGSQLWSARFTPDGAGVLTIGGDECRLWDAQTALSRISYSPTSVIAAASFSPTGDRIVTASWDNSARIWNTATGKGERKLSGVRPDEAGTAGADESRTGHSGRVNSAVFSLDGDMVLTAADDRQAILWNARTGEVIRKFTGHTSAVRSAVFSPDGQHILTASSDLTARVWDRESGRELFRLEGHRYAVTSAVYSPDGALIATASEDTTARIWDARTGAAKGDGKPLAGHTAAITSVVFLPPPAESGLRQSSRLLTGSLDNTAKVWDPETGKEVLTLRGHTQEVTGVDASPDGRRIVTGSRDGSAIVWLTEDWWIQPKPVEQAVRSPGPTPTPQR